MRLSAAMLLHQLGNSVAKFLDAFVADQPIAVDHERNDGYQGALGIDAPPQVVAVDGWFVSEMRYVACEMSSEAIHLLGF